MSAGLSRDELLNFVRENSPKIIDVDVEEKDEFFVLIIKYKDIRETHAAIHKIGYSDSIKNEEEKRVLEKIRFKTQEEAIKILKKFGEELADELIDKFRLDEDFKRKYEDTNVIYKVRKWYNIRDNYRVNFELYYQERLEQMIPAFQLLWEVCAKEEVQHDNLKEMTEYLHGARERFKQILFALDRIKDVLAVGSDNDVWFLVNYHLFYFISLVKSLGDNLAWILKYYCKINLNPLKIDLLRKSFQMCLKSNHRRLYSLIYENASYGDFDKLKEFRDIVLHRHALHVVPVQIGIRGEERLIMVPVDPESGVIADSLKLRMRPEPPKLAEAYDKESIAKYGLKQMIVWVGPKEEMPFEDPIAFCDKYINFLFKVYGDVCQRILLEMKRKLVGKVTNYFSKLGVAIVELTDGIHLNDDIVIEGTTTFLRQKAFSMQIDKNPIENAKAGQLIGLKVIERVRENDYVYRLV